MSEQRYVILRLEDAKALASAASFPQRVLELKPVVDRMAEETGADIEEIVSRLKHSYHDSKALGRRLGRLVDRANHLRPPAPAPEIDLMKYCIVTKESQRGLIDAAQDHAKISSVFADELQVFLDAVAPQITSTHRVEVLTQSLESFRASYKAIPAAIQQLSYHVKK